MADERTLAVYAQNAAAYSRRFDFDEHNRHLTEIARRLPRGGRVLDLGCGPGKSAAALLQRGFVVDAWDASPEMVALAKDMGVEARCATFDALDACDHYDAVYANFSLLHAPKSEMPQHLGRIARALKPGGLFHVGLKTGKGENRDRLGRFYAYYTPDEIEGLLVAHGFRILVREEGAGEGLDGTVAPWIILLSEKTDV